MLKGYRTAETRRSTAPSRNRRALDARADQRFGPGLLDRAAQALAQIDLRLPAQQVAGKGDVRLADLGIVGGQRLEDDLRPRPGQLDHRLRELQQRELVRVADVHRLVGTR